MMATIDITKDPYTGIVAIFVLKFPAQPLNALFQKQDKGANTRIE